MTVQSGRGWRLAPSLVALEAEANRLAPRRSQASDGSIGDPAHRARTSDHNPSGGWVHALDLTHDPRGGFDAHAWGRAIAARRDRRVKYLISSGRIWQPGTGWSGYGGSNPHRTHLHVSILATDAARQDTSPWLAGVPAAQQSTPAPPPRRPTLARFLTDNPNGMWWLVADDLQSRTAVASAQDKADIITLSREQRALTGVPILVDEQVRVVSTAVLRRIPDLTPQ